MKRTLTMALALAAGIAAGRCQEHSHAEARPHSPRGDTGRPRSSQPIEGGNHATD